MISYWKNPVSPQVYWDRSGNQVRSLWAGYVDLVLVAVCSSRKIMSLETSQIQSVSHHLWLLGVIEII